MGQKHDGRGSFAWSPRQRRAIYGSTGEAGHRLAECGIGFWCIPNGSKRIARDLHWGNLDRLGSGFVVIPAAGSGQQHNSYREGYYSTGTALGIHEHRLRAGYSGITTPPLGRTVWPVIKRPASEHKYKMA